MLAEIENVEKKIVEIFRGGIYICICKKKEVNEMPKPLVIKTL